MEWSRFLPGAPAYQVEHAQVREAREALHDLYPIGREIELLEVGAALQALDPREESPMDE